MAEDDPTKTALDRKLIALGEEHEVRSWSRAPGCTEAQLRAVKAVGNSAEKGARAPAREQSVRGWR
ncbi:DUF3606 domain-containing protein [Variovorax sp. J22R133]|uniref:DUF3606 domain-containing protein n=1 Tax=Variovorax brevis TaxID=3053503 RepID=UPI002578D973|nr:DUF3606 domain-containing protein [Variovorax sp. J22R133]MDM0117129.1 DUF3606 domain-containing protein [Variovorax sp. J22R133]